MAQNSFVFQWKSPKQKCSTYVKVASFCAMIVDKQHGVLLGLLLLSCYLLVLFWVIYFSPSIMACLGTVIHVFDLNRRSAKTFLKSFFSKTWPSHCSKCLFPRSWFPRSMHEILFGMANNIALCDIWCKPTWNTITSKSSLATLKVF